MTDESRTKIENAVESLAFKGFARLAMLVFPLFGVPAVIWLVTTVNNAAHEMRLLNQAVAHNMVLVESNDRQIRGDLDSLRSELRERTATRYGRDDADRDFKLRDFRIDNVERRVDGLEMRR